MGHVVKKCFENDVQEARRPNASKIVEAVIKTTYKKREYFFEHFIFITKE